MTSEHRYPLAALLPDYGRGLLGATLSGGAWSLAPAAPAAIVIFGGLTGLFLGNVPIDLPLSKTMFVVAHFHMVMAVSPVLSSPGFLCAPRSAPTPIR